MFILPTHPFICHDAGNADCAVFYYNDSFISCELPADNMLEIGQPHLFQVVLENLGNALILADKDLDRYFVPLPYVSHVFPSNGSIEGGTVLILQGSGLLVNISKDT